MHVHIFTYTHTHIYIYIYITYIYTYICRFGWSHEKTRAYACTHRYVYTFTYIYTQKCIHIYIDLISVTQDGTHRYVYTFTYIYTQICIHIYIDLISVTPRRKLLAAYRVHKSCHAHTNSSTQGMWYIWLSHGCDTYDWVMPQTWLCLTHINESWC